MSTKLSKKGLGVGARVELKTDYVNRFSGEVLQKKGAKGTVVDRFGSSPTIMWDTVGTYGKGPQVVRDINALKVTKKSRKKAVELSTTLDEVERELGSQYEIKGNRITMWKYNSHYDEFGFHVGDYTIEAKGRLNKDGTVDITSSRVLVGEIPRGDRPMIREYFESQSLEDSLGVRSRSKLPIGKMRRT